MTRKITKNDKIRILVNKNKKLLEENEKLKKLSNEEISQKMIVETSRYSDVIDKLYGKYRELNELRFFSVRNQWKYRVMLIGFTVRRILGI